MSQIVFDATEIGDLRAEKIINDAFNELACAVETVTSQLEFTHPFGIVLSGGNLTYQNILADKLGRWIEKTLIGSSVMFPKHEPAYGAIVLAMVNI